MKRGLQSGILVMVFFMTALGIFPAPVQAKTEIVWWHAMTGFLGERVNEIAGKFNASQNEFVVKALHKGGV